MSKLLDALFGCSHKRYTFPMSAKRARCSEAAAMTGTYVVCLDCGREFPYDWREMKVIPAKAQARGAAVADTTEVANRAA
jgi:hypothetical protein